MTILCNGKKEKDRYSLKSIYGDCLEGAGLFIPHGAYARIDANAKIKVGDLVHCNKISGSISSYIKQVKEIKKRSIIVRTCYLDQNKDFEFEAAEIMGVVTEVYCKMFGSLVYKRNSKSNQKE